MAADIFTKPFTNPATWEAVSWLVNVCDVSQVEELVLSGNMPPPAVQGGGKRGTWEIYPDGSGTWTRHDRAAVRCRTLYRSGPARHEVHTRHTFDSSTGEHLDTTKSFATAKIIDQELPSPRPRPLRSVFVFDSTQAPLPADAVRVNPSPDGEAEGPAQAGVASQSKSQA